MNNSSTPIGVNLSDNKNERKNTWTDNQTAKKAGVGVGTVARYNRVMNSDDEEIKEKVLSGEMSISAGYNKTIGHRNTLCPITLLI